MKSSTKILLHRAESYADSFRNYSIYLNGECIGEISQNQTLSFPVKPGNHEIFLKIDWCRSKKLQFDISSGEEVEFFCKGRSRLESQFVLLLIIFFPWRYINLSKK